MSKYLLLISLILLGGLSRPQNTDRLTLEFCQNEARANYPMLKQKDIISSIQKQNISNARTGYLPQLNISGQATYQSDVTALSIPLPMFKMEPMSKDQYKAVAEITQLIFDGFAISVQNDIHTANAEIEQNKVEVELRKLKEQVNQLFFGVLLTREQQKQVNLIKTDIMAMTNKVTGAYNNGLATKADVDVLKAELLKAMQKETELLSTEKAFLAMLGLLMNRELNQRSDFIRPETFTPVQQPISRPELSLYASQEKLFNEQKGLVLAKFLPKANLFFQGGYGRPGLNMLKDEFKLYYVTGVRFSWALSSLYTYSGDNEILEFNQKTTGLQRDAFLLNTNLALKQNIADIEKLNTLIKIDEDIINLRHSIKESAKAQLENGTSTSNDFIRELNQEDQAAQNKALHEIQLLAALQNYKTTLGN